MERSGAPGSPLDDFKGPYSRPRANIRDVNATPRNSTALLRFLAINRMGKFNLETVKADFIK